MSDISSDSKVDGDNERERLVVADRQMIALERIADGMEALRDDLRAIYQVLQRTAIRGTHGQD